MNLESKLNEKIILTCQKYRMKEIEILKNVEMDTYLGKNFVKLMMTSNFYDSNVINITYLNKILVFELKSLDQGQSIILKLIYSNFESSAMWRIFICDLFFSIYK